MYEKIDYMNIRVRLVKKLTRRILKYYLKLLINKNVFYPKTHDLIIQKSGFYIDEPFDTAMVNVNNDYLYESGWIETKFNNVSYFNNNYYPWITFPAIDFLDSLLLSKSEILEFGAGASTIFFANRARNVISYEFDPIYYSQITEISKLYKNVQILNGDLASSVVARQFKIDQDQTGDLDLISCLSEDLKNFNLNADKIYEGNFYSSLCANISQSDFIFIDGGPRNSALLLTARFAKQNAVVLVDNTDSAYLSIGLKILREAGFHEIPFAGLGPLNPFKWQSSFFIKDLEAITVLYNRP